MVMEMMMKIEKRGRAGEGWSWNRWNQRIRGREMEIDGEGVGSLKRWDR